MLKDETLLPAPGIAAVEHSADPRQP